MLGFETKSPLSNGFAVAMLASVMAAPAAAEPAFTMRQQDCVAAAIYWEARGRSSVAQIAVAHVIRNRVRSEIWPSTPCAVVFQRDRRRCQFDFACRRGRITDMAAWQEARRLATLANQVPDVTGGATYFHASYIQPGWRHLRRTARLDGNVFYAERRRG